MTDPYRIRPVETWIRARDDYLSGYSAETVCRRYDLGLSAFRRRARKYGWRRSDQVQPPPGEAPRPDQADLSLYADINLEAQIRTAGLRFIEALEVGKAVEARRWRRLWLDLNDTRSQIRQTMMEEMTPLERAAFLADSAREEAETEEEDRLLPVPPPD